MPSNTKGRVPYITRDGIEQSIDMQGGNNEKRGGRGLVVTANA